MRKLLLILLGLISTAHAAVPCEGVNRALTATRRRELAPLIARQLAMPSVVVLESMVLKNWSVIWVSTPASGSPFLFYGAPPEHTHFLAAWNGATRRATSTQMQAWALASVPGVPPALARCFAWHVGSDAGTAPP